MFKIYETRENREELMKKILSEDPCVALVIAFIDFEWTVRRCILALGKSTTKDIRAMFAGKLLKRSYRNDESTKFDRNSNNKFISGLQGYRGLWNAEVTENGHHCLADILNSKVKVSNVEGFDNDKFNHIAKNNSSIKNTDQLLTFVYKAFRNTLIHGVRTSVQDDTAKFFFNFIVACSRALCSYAEEKGEPIYNRKIVRRKISQKRNVKLKP
jgi:hypothetical protein